MGKCRAMLPYLLVLFLAFYLLPLLIQDTGSSMFILLIGMPAVCFIVSLIFGLKHSFTGFFPLFVMLLFAPSIFIFYNESAAIYVVAYGVIGLIGNVLGSLCHKK